VEDAIYFQIGIEYSVGTGKITPKKDGKELNNI
jgi:hypothetical protein